MHLFMPVNVLFYPLMLKEKTTYRVIGLMSGTSLDGTDIALCSFRLKNKKWRYSVERTQTFPYSKQWKDRLSKLESGSALEFAQTHVDYGHYLGQLVNTFLRKNHPRPEFVASHGHTVFHQPFNGLSSQVGDGASIAAECGLPAVCDFRSKDIALGGQGAPLVPIGDALLFKSHSAFLNLGGFANCSLIGSNGIQAFDICPLNIVFNLLSHKLQKKYDPEGSLARRGQVNTALLNKLNKPDYYRQLPPKSLGKEWVVKNTIPLLNNSASNPFDLLRTFSEHASIQIAAVIKRHDSILVTGGGAYNKFLLERIRYHTGKKTALGLPDSKTIEFKEALIFAFLGVLRWRQEVNSLKSVTGASSDSVGGCIYL